MTDSGIGFDFDQITALRSRQPELCSANATRQGSPMRFFADSCDPLRTDGSCQVAEMPLPVS